MKLKDSFKKKCKSFNAAPLPNSVWTHPRHFIACGFGIGALPLMPGTFATLFSVFIVLIMAPLSWIPYTLICIALCLLGVWLCDTTNRDFNEKDHPGVCFDEIAAFPICLIGIPCTWYSITLAFIVFRILDIAKPFPINYLEDNIKGGLGVMLDDIAAALACLALMQGLHYLIKLF